MDLSLSSSNNITSHPSQAKGDFRSAAELPLPAKSPSRIPLIYTAPVIVPVVIVEQLVVVMAAMNWSRASIFPVAVELPDLFVAAFIESIDRACAVSTAAFNPVSMKSTPFR